jgi:hypothetical protein
LIVRLVVVDIDFVQCANTRQILACSDTQDRA